MQLYFPAIIVTLALTLSMVSSASTNENIIFKAGHPSLAQWVLADTPPTPEDNPLVAEKIELGKMLFFDPRLSGDKNMSCASCHNPMLGWSDGLPTAKGSKSKTLARATPTIINAGYNSIQMWDGREPTLEHQALGPILNSDEMNTNIPALLDFLRTTQGYQRAFDQAFPNEGISKKTIAKALATFQRTVVSNQSRFDQWLAGENSALTDEEILGFQVFIDPNKGNCEVCHSAPNFTDNGFHNIGLTPLNERSPDQGRYAIKPVRLMKGAFKTPTIRDIDKTAPYFHNGSAQTLEEVVDHYIEGGKVKTNLSPSLKPLELSQLEKQALIAFMKTLSSPDQAFELPTLPQ